MKKRFLFIALTSFSTLAFAGTAEFSEVDTNADGVLSTSEAKEALPEILIVDNNNDGMLNPAEAEVAVPGLMLTTSEEDKETALIGKEEYDSIVKVLSELEAGAEDNS